MQARRPPAASIRESAPRIWTSRRQVMGNVIPALFALPFAVVGLLVIVNDAQSRGQIVGWGLALFGSSFVVGWLAVNAFGLFENREMRAEFVLRLRDNSALSSHPHYFVGFASPTYFSWMDPNEDIGFLVLLPDRVEFFGDTVHVALQREQVTQVRMRANAYTLLGLGCWVCVEGRIGDHQVRLQVCPREARTLVGNLRLASKLRQRLEDWYHEKPEALAG